MRKVELSLQERRRGRKVSTEGGYILSLRARERLGERCGAFFNGKEGRDDFRANTSLMVKKNGMILEKQYDRSR